MRISRRLRYVVNFAIMLQCMQWAYPLWLSLRPVRPILCDGKMSCVSQADGDHADVAEVPEPHEFLDGPPEIHASGNVTLGVAVQSYGTVASNI